ncbi:5'-nucleotidase-related protein-like isoform X1 [Haematobia irritans]|uniref:5'-nucleotidase-related protein-like isoform X1 n=1 Tax=Haematobia irritans TaxID=7368 RepID=UPI003F4F5641
MKSQFLLVAFLLNGITIAPAFAADTKSELFPLSIIHINDFHARYEPTDTSGGACEASAECIGGYARTVYTVRNLLEQQKDKNPVYFNAGDSFQGSLWYNIGRWNVTKEFLNLLPADAMTLGNHEFDHGIDGVVPFLETLDSPMLVANIDSTNEPTMTGKYKPSMIIERSGRKIGVIGVILETTYDLANTGKLIFLNESESILEEAAKLKDQGANIIIVLSHCGYDVDKIIAEKTGSVVDVIVGSHSHTFLYTGDNPPGPDKPKGDYPTIIDHSSGRKVLIVQAGAYAKYVGNLTVFFDDEGNVVDFEGAPLYMDNKVPEANDVIDAMQPWKLILDDQIARIVGESKVDLLKSDCDRRECNIGNFFADSAVYAFTKLNPYNESNWTQAAIALINTGAIRVPLYKGNLSYGHISTMSPFENKMAAFTLPGAQVLEALEFSLNEIDLFNNKTSSSIFLQVSGLKVVYNFTKPNGHRVQQIKVRCKYCSVPIYQPLDVKEDYRIISSDFIAEGGGGFTMFRDYGKDLQKELTDLEAICDYVNDNSPITTGLENRISVVF